PACRDPEIELRTATDVIANDPLLTASGAVAHDQMRAERVAVGRHRPSTRVRSIAHRACDTVSGGKNGNHADEQDAPFYPLRNQLRAMDAKHSAQMTLTTESSIFRLTLT